MKPDAGTDRQEGHTKPQQGEGSVPRMPHERDESSDSQQHGGEPRPLMRKAHDDVAQGRVDTDRGQPMHDTYQRQKDQPSSPDSDPQNKT